MPERNLLFFCEDLERELYTRQQRVSSTVDDIPENQFLIASDQKLINHVVSKLTVEPIILHEEDTNMTSPQAVKVNMSHDPMRIFFFGDRSEPLLVNGTQVIAKIPFSGKKWIFKYRTNPYSSQFPCAEIKDGFIQIKIELADDVKPEAFKSEYETKISLIREYIGYGRRQIDNYNKSLLGLGQEAIKNRRNRLDHHSNIAKLFNIPLASRASAPSIKPVKIEIRRPSALPVPPENGLRPEPGIANETYEHILQCIRHQCRTFEQTPKTFSCFGEEGLRNIILANLNGYFQGDATGETFRGNGKTDIRIEEDNRAAFVGECKLWSGPKGLTNALSQLLSYLTWRDSKAALIIFNKGNKDFTKILNSIPEVLGNHSLFIKYLECDKDGEGEWRVHMKSAEDEGRRVSIHIFVFDLNIS